MVDWQLKVKMTRGPFLESPGNLPGPISVFGDKCFLQKSIFVSFEYWIFKSNNSIKPLAKNHVCNHCVIGEKTH